MHDYKLEEIIDIQLLQGFQDSFSRFYGIAAVITDSDGSCITRTSGFSRNCNDVSRVSTESVSRCMSFFIQGAKSSLAASKPFISKCHEGLYAIIAPIMLKDQFIGALVCGQILCTDEENTREFADITSIYHKSAEEIQKIAEYTYNLSKLISAAIDKNYILISSNQLHYTSLYSDANNIPEDFGVDKIYNIHELTNSINAGIEVICKKNNLTADKRVMNKVPPELLGNPSAIKYVIEGLVSFFAPYSRNNSIIIEYSCSKKYYSYTLGLKVIVYCEDNASDKLNELKNKFELVQADKPEGASIITYILNKILNGSIHFDLSDDSTISATLSIPQLDLKVD